MSGEGPRESPSEPLQGPCASALNWPDEELRGAAGGRTSACRRALRRAAGGPQEARRRAVGASHEEMAQSCCKKPCQFWR